MSLNEQILADLKEAMLAREQLRVETIRFLIADMKNYKIEKQRELTDDDISTLLERQVKRHRESIEGFEKGGRAEMAEKEKQELAILQTYLPAQMSEADIETAVVNALNSTGAATPQDMGKVMGALAPLRGKADFSLVSQIVKEKLS